MFENIAFAIFFCPSASDQSRAEQDNYQGCLLSYFIELIQLIFKTGLFLLELLNSELNSSLEFQLHTYEFNNR